MSLPDNECQLPRYSHLDSHHRMFATEQGLTFLGYIASCVNIPHKWQIMQAEMALQHLRSKYSSILADCKILTRSLRLQQAYPSNGNHTPQVTTTGMKIQTPKNTCAKKILVDLQFLAWTINHRQMVVSQDVENTAMQKQA